MTTNYLVQLLLILFITTAVSCGDKACEDVTCENGGECSSGNCYCPIGYTGDKCQYQTCDIANCPSNANCLPLGEWGAAVCRCNVGFEGHDCNIQSITKFLGEYTSAQECWLSSNNSPTDWSIVNNWSSVDDSHVMHFVSAGLSSFEQPIRAILLDSVQFVVFNQFSSYHQDFIMPQGNGIRATDGTISFRFVRSSTSDTCRLTFTPK